MSSSFDITANINAVDKASRVFDRVGKKAGGLGKMFSRMGDMATVAGGFITAQIGMKAAGAVQDFVSDSIDAFGDFETAMANVSTLLGEGEDAMALYGDQLKRMAEVIPVAGVNDLANGLYQVISAGVPASDALAVLEAAAKGAKAGVTDTFTAVDGLTTVLNAYRLEAAEVNRISDMFFSTVKIGKTTFPELASSMSNVVPIASAVGVAFEEVMGATASMTKSGYATAEATNAIRGAMNALLKPNAEMQAALEELGYTSGEAMLKELGLAGALETVASSTGYSADQLSQMFGHVEALGAVLTLTGEKHQAFKADIDAVAQSSGAAEEAFAKQADTHQSKMQMMQNAMQNLQMVLGEALAPALEEVAAVFSENKEEIKAVMSALGSLVKGGIWVAVAALKGFWVIGKGVLDFLVGFGKMIVNIGLAIGEAYDKYIKPIVDAISGAVDKIKGAFDWLADTLVGHSVWTDMLKEMEAEAKRYMPRITRQFETVGVTIGGGLSYTGGDVRITGPLLVIEGSADMATAEFAVAAMRRELRSVIIESTSPAGVTKMIRRR